MKRMLCLLAALLLLPCAALASSAVDDAISYASGSLTEVYSYTAEDAAAFTFEVEETDEGVVVTYFNHPGWNYTVVRSNDGDTVATTPSARRRIIPTTPARAACGRACTPRGTTHGSPAGMKPPAAKWPHGWSSGV